MAEPIRHNGRLDFVQNTNKTDDNTKKLSITFETRIRYTLKMFAYVATNLKIPKKYTLDLATCTLSKNYSYYIVLAKFCILYRSYTRSHHVYLRAHFPDAAAPKGSECRASTVQDFTHKADLIEVRANCT